MENFLYPTFAPALQIVSRTASIKWPPLEEQMHLPWAGWIQAWVLAVLAGGAAYYLYTMRWKRGHELKGLGAEAQKLSLNKFYFDELYDAVIVKPIKTVSFLFFKVIDSVLIDTIAVRGTAWVTVRLGSMLRYFQSGDAQGYAAVMALALAAGLGWALLKVLP
jgi:NADH-quinone oxidoreductase subunit L